MRKIPIRELSPISDGLMLGAGILVICLVLLSASSVAVQGGTVRPTPMPVHPLTNASPQEVDQAALNFSAWEFGVLSGTPHVILHRSVTLDELPALGLGSLPDVTFEKPPLVLVVMKGDFGAGVHSGTGQQGTSSIYYMYVGYVFDLWAGEPTKTIASPKGAEFRTVLNDPTLPMLPNVVSGPLRPTTAPSFHYGQRPPTSVPPVNPHVGATVVIKP